MDQGHRPTVTAHYQDTIKSGEGCSMSRKPAVISYDNVTIGPKVDGIAAASQTLPAPVAVTPTRKLMRDDAAPVTLYLHPQARKALKRYAMENDVKVHDLMLEAVENWFRDHGLEGPVRVQPMAGQ
jgi:hypothetical protein